MSMLIDKLASVRAATSRNIKSAFSGADYSTFQLERNIVESTYKEIAEALSRVKSKELKEIDKIESEVNSD